MSPVFEPHSTIGAILIGVIISCCMFGICTVQAYRYYTQFLEDKKSFKWTVTIIWCLELAHYICLFHAFYVFSISGYEESIDTMLLPSSLLVPVIFSAIVSFITQAFFIGRVRIVSTKIVLPTVGWILSATRFALMLFLAGKSIPTISLSDISRNFKWLVIVIISLGTTVDISIAVTLAYFLRISHRESGTGYKRTTMVIDKITAWTFQPGIIASLTGLTMLISFLTLPKSAIWFGIFIFTGHLYTNSLFASLNGRSTLQKTLTGSPHSGPQRSMSSSGSVPSRLSIHVTKTTEVVKDPVFEHGIV